jgi:hypothetical protein
MAKQKCIDYGLLSPIYEFTNRGGCWFCPNMKNREIRHLRDNHKDLWNKLIELSEVDAANPYFDVFEKIKVKDIEERFCMEDAQMNIFEYLKE